MKYLALLFLNVLCYSTLSAQYLDWAISNSGRETQTIANDIALDADRNIYTTGGFRDQMDADPGTGVHTLTHVAFQDIFVSKCDSNRNLIWAFSIGTNFLYGEGTTIRVDDANDKVYVMGSFFGQNVDFDPSPNSTFYLSVGSQFSNQNSRRFFIACYTKSGAFVWAREHIGMGANDLVIDDLGNFYIGGGSTSIADFDPDPNVTVNLPGSSSKLFVAKYDVNGDFVSVFGVGSPNYSESVSGIALGKSGNIYITGYIRDNVDFNPNPNISNIVTYDSTSPGPIQYHDIFVAKYSPTGDYIWAFSAGGEGIDAGNSIALDSMENIFVGGEFSSYIADFDPDPNNHTNTHSNVSTDFFIAKYDSSGQYQWSFGVGKGFGETLNDLATDRNGNIYATGSFKGSTVDFGPPHQSPNGYLSAGGTGQEWYVAKYKNDGSFDWAFNIGGASGQGVGNAVLVDEYDNVFTSGILYGMGIDIDPDPLSYTAFSNIHYYTNPGSSAFVGKYMQKCAHRTYDYVQRVCLGDTVQFDGNPVTTTGIYSKTYTSFLGCDSTVNTTILFFSPSVVYQSLILCVGDTINFNGNSIVTTGQYVDTLSGMGGCDSIVHLDVELDLRTNSSLGITICSGYFYNFHGQMLTTTGIYVDTLSTINGCDSTVILGLTVSSAVTLIDTLISHENNFALGAIQIRPSIYTAELQFLWSNGDTTPNINNLTAGIYTLTITDSLGCDYIFDFEVKNTTSTTGIISKPTKVYPNPVTNKLMIENGIGLVVIHNLLGQEVYSIRVIDDYQGLYLNAIPSGHYIVTVIREDGLKSIFKIRKLE